MAFAALPLEAGQVVLTGEAEYSSNVLAYLHAGRRRGVRFETVPSDADGALDVAALERRLGELGERAALVAVTHVPTSNGLVNPAAEVGAVTRAAGVPFLLDACQSVGQLPVDVAEIGCDMLSATGRKYLRAPRGTGFLYVSDAIRDRLDPPFVDLRAADWVAEDSYVLRDDARRFEAWEASVADRLGLGAAVDYALGWGLPAIAERIGLLAADLRARLEATAGVRVHDTGRVRSGIVTFSVDGAPAPEVVERLRAARVNTSVSWAATAHLDLGRRGLGDLVRASVHYYNTPDELSALVEALPRPAPGA
jgi:selenocysteine lyase/cysteine desulfurase